MGSGINFLITFVGNLAYKIYIKRLYNEKKRIITIPKIRRFFRSDSSIIH